MPNTTVRAAAEGLPQAQIPERQRREGESYGEYWLRLYAKDVAVFAECDFDELEEIYDALKLAGDAACSILNRPYVDIDTTGGSYIHKIGELLDEKRTALIEHVRRRPLTTVKDYAGHCKILIRYEVDCGGGDLAEVRTLTDALLAKNPAQGRAA